MLSRFNTIPECIRHTDRQTNRQMDTIVISLSHVSIAVLTRDKNSVSFLLKYG